MVLGLRKFLIFDVLVQKGQTAVTRDPKENLWYVWDEDSFSEEEEINEEEDNSGQK